MRVGKRPVVINRHTVSPGGGSMLTISCFPTCHGRCLEGARDRDLAFREPCFADQARSRRRHCAGYMITMSWLPQTWRCGRLTYGSGCNFRPTLSTLRSYGSLCSGVKGGTWCEPRGCCLTGAAKHEAVKRRHKPNQREFMVLVGRGRHKCKPCSVRGASRTFQCVPDTILIENCHLFVGRSGV